MNSLVTVLLRARMNALYFAFVVVCVPMVMSYFLPTTTLADQVSAWGQVMTISMGFAGWVGSLLMALVTLRKGPREGALVLAILALPSMWIASATNDYTMVAGMFLLNNGLLWVLASVLAVSATWAMVIDVGVLLGVLVIMACHWIGPDMQQFWAAYIQKFVAARADLNAALSSEVVNALPGVAKLLSGFIGSAFLLSALFNLLVARFVQAGVFNPGGLRTELGQVRCSVVGALVTVLIYVGQAMGSAWALDAFLVCFWPLLFTGLSITHGRARRLKYPLLLLVPVYVVLALFPLFIGMVLCSVGLIDVVRRVLPGRKSNHNEIVNQ